jgi:DNA-binding MarR family transcriptional regulator
MERVGGLQNAVDGSPVLETSLLVESQVEALIKVLPRIARIFKSHWRGLSLTVPQMSMLMELQDLTLSQGGANPSELADRFCLSGPAVTAAIDELVDKGYCSRTHSEKDRRKVVIAITPGGATVLAEVRAAVAQNLRAMLSAWDEQRLARLLDALQDLDATADAYLSHNG